MDNEWLKWARDNSTIAVVLLLVWNFFAVPMAERLDKLTDAVLDVRTALISAGKGMVSRAPK
jgi:hypothetical protein